MGVDDQAKMIGYSTATEWLHQVREELDFGVCIPERLGEYDWIFTPEAPSPVTPVEKRLVTAFESSDWEALERGGWLDGDQLTGPATRMILNVWDKIDRASA